MSRFFCLLGILVASGSALSAQSERRPAHPTPNFQGTYRIDIHSPAPRGTWTALLIIKATSAGYQGEFRDPDGPGTYPVASVKASTDTLIVTMAGEATGSIFFLSTAADSIRGMMTSVTHGDTRVTGIRVKPWD